MKKLKICAPDIIRGDAVGNHCLELARIFRKNGNLVEIYAGNHLSEDHNISNFFNDLDANDVILLSFSIYDPLLLRIANLPNKKICYFHGITPSKFLTVYEPITAELCEKGFEQIPLLNKFDFVVCNSLGTAKLLNGTVDQKRIKVFPPFTKAIVNNGTVSNFVRNRDIFNIVQLGRVAPHKALEDGVRIIKDLKDQHAKISLCIVGSIGNQSYKDDLDRLIEKLGLSDRVFFTGFVDEQVKLKILAASDLMLSTSYHEGYGIPIIEAMGMGLPVLVRKNAIYIDSFNSHILEFDDIQNAAAIIKMLISDDHFRDCYSKNAKTFAKIIFEATNDDETYIFYKNNCSIF